MQKRIFGIQIKVLFLLLPVLLFFALAGAQVYRGLTQIESRASDIAEVQTPFINAIEAALSSMITAQNAAEQALDIDAPDQMQTFKDLEQTFETDNQHFKMYLASITWGSESEAFKHADDGADYMVWTSEKLNGKLIVQQAPPEEAQLTAQASVYYEGFVNNVRRAFASRQMYLDLSAQHKTKDADIAKSDSKNFQATARDFSRLATENLHTMVERSSDSTAASAEGLVFTENSVLRGTSTALIAGLILSLIISIIFAQLILIRPLRDLSQIAGEFGAGKLARRANIKSHDELGVLGASFNAMADRIIAYTTDLQSQVAARTSELAQKVHELSGREKELSTANEQLRELDRVKSDFISVAAHQLRTPLSALKWSLGIVLDEESANLTSEQRSLLLKGFESNERMINLINEMLVVTRIESGKERFTFAPIHIEDLIENTVIDFAGQAHVRNIKLDFQRPQERLPFISADPEKMRAVVQNLIENGMRYTPDGGSITISAKLVERLVQVSVADSGIGIPEEQKASIFKKFFRADNAVKTHTDGTGLGLYISRQVVERHGGTLSFESTVGKGTTFTFTVPMSTDVEQKQVS